LSFLAGKKAMIRKCEEKDFEAVYSVINDAAQAYKGVIPADRFKEPYLSREELRHEIEQGVVFWGYEENNQLIGVMGIQPVQDVTLIRHAYVRTKRRNQGIGGKLLSALLGRTDRPVLIGTWKDATWAITFYQKHGFKPLSTQQTDRLLRKYFSLNERQIQTSIVLADKKWLSIHQKTDTTTR
jgi:N-acetylglutamate synthase-like GNAT family acetyltransferase